MTDKHVLGPDIDLDVEVVRDKKGRRITEAREQRLAREALARPGQTPLAHGPGARSPEVKARVPAEMKHRLEREAKRHGATTSTLIRDALDRYLRGA